MSLRRTGIVGALSVASAIAGCTSLIGEPFEGYMLHRDAGVLQGRDDAGASRASPEPDGGIDSAVLVGGDAAASVAGDADVVDAETVRPDADGLVPLDASSPDGSSDAEPAEMGDAGDAGDAARGARTRLGREGGCEGIPFRSYEFDHDVEGWKVEDPATVDASVSYVAGEGSPGRGALRFSIGFDGPNEIVKMVVGLPDHPTVKCVSARIQVAPNTFDDDLTANPGTWTLAALTPPGCFAQRPYANTRDLPQTGVWYDVAFDTKDFRYDGRACDFGEVDTLAIGIANAYGTTTAKPAEVLVDYVALF